MSFQQGGLGKQEVQCHFTEFSSSLYSLIFREYTVIVKKMFLALLYSR